MNRTSMAALLLAGALGSGAAFAGPKDDCDQAEIEFARGDLIAAIGLWQKSATAGYAPAQARMGDIMDKSEQDEDAVEWFSKAAKQGDAHGSYGLGMMYAKGEGVKLDYVTAVVHIRKAAEQDYLEACVTLLEAYRIGGLGLAADKAAAAQWEVKVRKLFPSYQSAPVRTAGKGKNAEVRK